MRIIAGKYRSRVLIAPQGLATRPTSDRLRETLFNVLGARVEGSSFLDLYAGSGAVGLEALSRGAVRVQCVEQAQAARDVLWANVRKLGVEDGVRICRGSVAAYLARASGPWDFVFLDPPYDAEKEYEQTLGRLGGEGWPPRSANARDRGHPVPFLSSDAVVVAEHRRKARLADQYGALTRKRLLEQGDAALSLYGLSV
jgi:16S rRNA (guanine966-N2)-methyltransferase